MALTTKQIQELDTLSGKIAGGYKPTATDTANLSYAAKQGYKYVAPTTTPAGMTQLTSPEQIANYNIAGQIGKTGEAGSYLYGTPKSVQEKVSNVTSDALTGGVNVSNFLTDLGIKNAQTATTTGFPEGKGGQIDMLASITDEINNIRNQYRDVSNAAAQGQAAYGQRVIPMSAITGKQRALQEQADLSLKALSSREASLTDKLNAVTNLFKMRDEYQKEQVAQVAPALVQKYGNAIYTDTRAIRDVASQMGIDPLALMTALNTYKSQAATAELTSAKGLADLLSKTESGGTISYGGQEYTVLGKDTSSGNQIFKSVNENTGDETFTTIDKNGNIVNQFTSQGTGARFKYGSGNSSSLTQDEKEFKKDISKALEDLAGGGDWGQNWNYIYSRYGSQLEDAAKEAGMDVNTYIDSLLHSEMYRPAEGTLGAGGFFDSVGNWLSSVAGWANNQ